MLLNKLNLNPLKKLPYSERFMLFWGQKYIVIFQKQINWLQFWHDFPVIETLLTNQFLMNIIKFN